MRQIVLIASIMAIMFSSTSCNGQGNKKEVAQTLTSSEVSVYYFHFTRRCATCMAVEENARKAVEALYPEEVKKGTYSFTAINLDETSSKELANKLGIGGQTLLVVHGEKKADITSAGFLNAHDPDKMKEEIKAAVANVLL